MKHATKTVIRTLLVLLALLAILLPQSAVLAEDMVPGEVPPAQTTDSTSSKAVAAAVVVGIAAAAGAVSMGIAISKSAESMARQPEAAGKINSALMLGLVFIETTIIYGLIVAILIFFVL